MLIPNEDIITSRVTNWTYTNTRARVDIPLTTTYGSDPDLILKLLVESAKQHPGYVTDPPPAAYLLEFSPIGMQFLLIFWIPDIKVGMNTAKSDVMLHITRAFKANNITFATS
jgi:small-conductance mechanosensitive channel